MFGHPQQGMNADDVMKLRQQAGLYLRSLRETAGLSQRELAKLTDIGYYSFISQIESGRGRVPPEKYQMFADALQVDAKQFVMQLLRYYDPHTFRILCPPIPRGKAARAKPVSQQED
ncbi:helix-turn-helix domain-containing protein [Pararhizobium haloflavum]|uniref:helix-turn-helix domain-containing protein n=1 Tax=Pararhizobium haloflavum TaxID=2037914 RepID=UPI000C18C2E7|nr:helix-turn-helix transcriptional regulator [Pararhizobium haloflavum]